MLSQVAEGVLIHESDFMQSSAAVVHSAGRLGIPLNQVCRLGTTLHSCPAHGNPPCPSERGTCVVRRSAGMDAGGLRRVQWVGGFERLPSESFDRLDECVQEWKQARQEGPHDGDER